MYPSLSAVSHHTKLLILESEFFLEHQYQRDEPMKNKWYLFRKIIYKEKITHWIKVISGRLTLYSFPTKKIEIWEGDGAKQNRIWKPNTAHIDW